MNPTDLQSLILSANAEYWSSIEGDRTLRLNYDLDKNSIVFDLGGYQGEWSEQIYQRYGCRIFVFEPVPIFASQIIERFRGNDDISVFGVALGSKDGRLQLTLNDNATSSYVAGRGTTIEAKVKSLVEFLEEYAIQKIDLMKINIEGGEFELLDHLISTGCISRVRHVQVQFHNFVPCADELVENIRRRLWQTHAPTYSLDWIWENWTRTIDLADRKAVLESGLQWHQQALRGMSAFASRHVSRNRELEEASRQLAEDSRILNEWRRKLRVVLRIRNLIRHWR